jgi:hypothetical protein
MNEAARDVVNTASAEVEASRVLLRSVHDGVAGVVHGMSQMRISSDYAHDSRADLVGAFDGSAYAGWRERNAS